MKKRIALVVNSLSGGGAEKTVANLSRYISKRYEIDLIVNDDAVPQYSYHGKLISLHMPENQNHLATGYQIKAFIRRVRLLKKLKKQRQYSAVVSFSEMTNLANVLTGGKTIISVHNSVKNSKTIGWKYRIVTHYLFPYMFHKADKTISCSKEILDELVSDYGLSREKGSVIYNGIELEEIMEIISSCCLKLPRKKEDEIHIVSIGRLTRQKGQWHLIRVVKKLRDDGIKIKLMIFGEGDLRNSLEKLIREGDLKDAVILPSFVDKPEYFMTNADVVVFPSLYEGFSNAIVEALACGAPIISTDHETGAREILAPDTDYHRKTYDKIDEAQYGILVPVCDGEFRNVDLPLTMEEQLMADAICRLINNPELAEHYRTEVLIRAGQLDLSKIAECWVQVIEN